jgi:hypothetical protein
LKKPQDGDGTYGLTKKTDFIHFFRNNHTICPTSSTSKGKGHAWLFVARPDHVPTPGDLTCPACLKILEFEAREARGKPPHSPQSR